MSQQKMPYLVASIILNILLVGHFGYAVFIEENPSPEVIYIDRSVEPLEQLEREDTIRIATFNIKIFGQTKMGKPEVVSELVNIFDRYDMVSVQEIKDINQQVPYQFLDELRNGSSSEWSMQLSERSGQQEDDIGGQEQYAIYYRSTIVTPTENGSLHNDTLLDDFQREPFITEFSAITKNGEISDFKFTIVSIHTSPTVAVEELNALGNLSANLSPELNLILLGDLNADCDYAALHELDSLLIRNENHTWIVPDNADTTVSATRCAYDRIILDEDVAMSYTGWWGIDREMSGGNVSDHYPIWFELRRP
tara:strand:- start:458 stop:1384 length:927 start_codon:yes stop_codon:yes gene_type:complete